MKSLLLPLLLALIGLGAGGGAGLFLRPQPEEEAMLMPCGEEGADMVEDVADVPEDLGSESDPTKEYVKLNNQFIVPIVEDGRVASMVVLSLNLEVTVGAREAVYAREPKLRDSFLQVLFDHANSGGFSENFTTGTKMRRLSEALREVARKVMGPTVTDVLITDIVRQDG